jgi:heme/copper-type cytochrome/quinol oxidase subunit 3
MQDQTSYFKKTIPLFICFVIVNCTVIPLKNWLQNHQINADVIIVANCLLFILSSINIALHKIALQNKNPNAAVRSVMGGTLIKLMVISISILIYLFIAGEKRNSYGIFCGMILYLIYSIIEVRIATKMKRNDGKN